jgi:hypothetical protein
LVDLLKFVDDKIDMSYKITLERFNKSTFSKSFFVEHNGKKDNISYLNAVTKLGIANRKLKIKEKEEIEENKEEKTIS